ncbi:MAG: transposase, partial [Hoeflea sp.]|nr:transposase [Hoeflea sp.]
CRAGSQGRQARPTDDRCDSSQGTPDGGEPAKKGALPRRIGRTKGGLNSKLHAVCDGKGRPLIMLLSEGQMSDYKGAALMIDAFPKAKALLADRGYDAARMTALFRSDFLIHHAAPPKATSIAAAPSATRRPMRHAYGP